MRAFAQKPKTTQQTPPAKSTMTGRAQVGQSRASFMLQLQLSNGNNAVGQLPQPHAQELEDQSPTGALPRLGHDFSRIPVHADAPAAIQPKLRVNTPGDAHEQEADRAAEQVMRMPEAQLQRTCACGGGCPTCKNEQATHESLQTKRVEENDAGEMGVPPIVHEALRSSGQQLDPATRAFMEPRFGHDFSRARMHADIPAGESARAMNARAFTVGKDVVFGGGQYEPETTAGKRLLAHELAHVVQQQTGVARLQRQKNGEGDPFEFKGTPEYVSASLTIPGGRTLTSDWKVDVRTQEETRLDVSASPTTLEIGLDPPLLIDLIWPAYDLEWSGLTFSFKSRKISDIALSVASWTDYFIESPILGPLGYIKAKSKIEELFYAIIKGTKLLAAENSSAVYNPFKDANVGDTVLKIMDNFLREFSTTEPTADPNGVGTKDIGASSLSTTIAFPEGQEIMSTAGGLSIPAGAKLYATAYMSGSLDKAMNKSTQKIDYIEVEGKMKLKTADGSPQVILKKIKIEYGGKVIVKELEMLNENAKALETGETLVRLFGLLSLLSGSGDKGRMVLSQTSSDVLKPKVMNAIELVLLEERLTQAVIGSMQSSYTKIGELDFSKLMGIPALKAKSK